MIAYRHVVLTEHSRPNFLQNSMYVMSCMFNSNLDYELALKRVLFRLKNLKDLGSGVNPHDFDRLYLLIFKVKQLPAY